MGKIKFYWEDELSKDLIYATWKSAFNKSLHKEYWRWRFINNPNEPKIYIAYIIEDGILASYYAVSSLFINLPNKKVIKSGLVNMAMTHPKFQGKGYLSQTGKELHKVLRKDGFINLISFPTRSLTHKLFKKYFGWIDIFPLYIMTANSSCYKTNLSNIKSNLNFKTGRVDFQAIRIACSLRNQEKSIYPLWDFKGLCWRLIENPLHEYHYLKIFEKDSISCVIFYKYYTDNSIDIMEYYYSNLLKKEKLEILQRAISYFIKLGLKINIWSNKYADNYDCLQHLGFHKSTLQTNFGYIPLEKCKNFNKPENWHISFIDTDVY